MYDTYRICVRRIIRVCTHLSGNLSNVRILLSIPNAHYISVQLVHDKKNPSDEECGETARFVTNVFTCTEPVSGILLKREPLTRCKRGRWARSRHALLVAYVLQQQSAVPGTVPWCCCIIRHTNKIEATKRCRTSRSDLQQQQRSSIMMHPSCRPAAQRQRCSHAPIQFSMHVDMVLVPGALRA